MVRDSSVWKPGARRDFAGPVLFDTHIWLWYLDDAGGRLSSDAVRLLKRCVTEQGAIVSDISVWEVGNKAVKGQLTLKPDVSAWIRRAENMPGFEFVALDREILLKSTMLPGALHGDRADRMLIATALLRSIPLITADREIIRWARSSPVSVCDARS